MSKEANPLYKWGSRRVVDSQWFEEEKIQT